MTLREFETELLALQHHPKCPVHKEGHICECGLSRGRSDLLDYIESMETFKCQN